MNYIISQIGASYSIANFLALSHPADAQNVFWVFVVGIFDRKDILNIGWVL